MVNTKMPDVLIGYFRYSPRNEGLIVYISIDFNEKTRSDAHFVTLVLWKSAILKWWNNIWVLV